MQAKQVFFLLLVVAAMTLLCFAFIKIAYWMERIDKKVDRDTIGFDTDDYEINRKIRVASIVIFFVIATIGIIILLLK